MTTDELKETGVYADLEKAWKTLLTRLWGESQAPKGVGRLSYHEAIALKANNETATTVTITIKWRSD